jgi:hypothetical protein
MKNLPNIIGLALLALLVYFHFDGCHDLVPPTPEIVHTRDTLWQHYDTVVKKPMVIKQVIHDTIPVVFDAHPDYDSLKNQYTTLVSQYTDKNIYQDSIAIGSYGRIILDDTVQLNKLGQRHYQLSYSIPTIIDTVKIIEKAAPKPALYLGAGYATNLSSGTLQLSALYKDKKDHLSGVYIALLPQGKVTYGVQKYWKITLKR